MRRIAIQNLKGGTAKTTTAVNLAHGLALRGKRVLLLDADVQGNVAACLGLGRPVSCLYHLLIEDLSIANCVIPSGRERLDVLPSDRSLAVAEVQLRSYRRCERLLRGCGLHGPAARSALPPPEPVHSPLSRTQSHRRTSSFRRSATSARWRHDPPEFGQVCRTVADLDQKEQLDELVAMEG